MKLEITNEIIYNNKSYFIDRDNVWYKVALGVTCPCHPIVSYKKYNNSSLYVKVEDKDVIAELESELEKMLKEVDEKNDRDDKVLCRKDDSSTM